MADESFTRLDMSVAWAKRSGLRLLSDPLNAFTARGGRVRIIVGISAGGATRQGLELVMNLATEAYVFHDPSNRIFHTKCYVVRGEDSAVVVIGSNNLTRGGLVENYETAVCFELDTSSAADSKFLDDVDVEIERLLSMVDNCIPLTEATIEKLMADPAFRIGDEDVPRANSQRDSEHDTFTLDPIGTGIFAPLSGLKRAPSTREATDPSVSTIRRDAGGVLGAAPVAGTLTRRWYKKMSRTDAQHLPPNSHPTGHLTLVQFGHPIQTGTWFRFDLFDFASWYAETTQSGEQERADIEFQVTLDGTNLGIVTLSVTHTPNFESDQGNRTTTLLWGEGLGEFVKATDYTGYYATIERRDSSQMSLIIGGSPTGEFVG